MSFSVRDVKHARANVLTAMRVGLTWPKDELDCLGFGQPSRQAKLASIQMHLTSTNRRLRCDFPQIPLHQAIL